MFSHQKRLKLKQAKLIIVGLLFSISLANGQNTCSVAETICTNLYMNFPNAPTSQGNSINTNTSCLKSGELNGKWLQFQAAKDGVLNFVIYSSYQADYDWAVYDITGTSCDEIKNKPNLEIACNYAKVVGVTGASNQAGANFSPPINVVAGRVYRIFISYYNNGVALAPNATGQGFSIDLNSSTWGMFNGYNYFNVTQSAYSVCAGSSLEMSVVNPVSGLNYIWTNDDGSEKYSGATVTITPKKSSPYRVKAENTYGCSTAEQYTYVYVAPTPDLKVTPSSTNICNESVNISVSGAWNYNWEPAPQTNYYNSVTVAPTKTTTYKVTGLMGNCKQEKEVTINVNCNKCKSNGYFYERSQISGANQMYFGKDMDNIGDLDGDGINDLIVSSRYGVNASAEIEFLNADGSVKSSKLLEYPNILKFPVILGGDQSVSVAYLGDLDGPGGSKAAVAIGHRGDDDGYVVGANGVMSQSDRDRGAVVIVFLNSDGTIFKTQKISALAGGFTGELNSSIVDVNEIQQLFGSTDSDHFGASVANLGDLDGPGPSFTAIAVGAPGDDDESPEPPSPWWLDVSWRLRRNNGAVWILFLNADGTVLRHNKISDINIPGGLETSAIALFGNKVEEMGDLDGPGGAVNYIMAAKPYSAPVRIIGLDANGNPISVKYLDLNSPAFNGKLSEYNVTFANFKNLNGVSTGVSTMAISDGQGVFITQFNASGDVKSALEVSSAKYSGIQPVSSFGSSMAFLGDLDKDGNIEFAVGDAKNETSRVYIISSCKPIAEIISEQAIKDGSVLRTAQFTSEKEVLVENKLKIYPTLVSSTFTISNVEDGSIIRIFNSVGNEMIQEQKVNNNEVVNMNQVLPGIYIVQVISSAENKSIKIIKE